MSKFLSNFYCFTNQEVEQSTLGKWNESPTASYMSSTYKSRHWCAWKETPDVLVYACAQNQSWNWHLLTMPNSVLCILTLTCLLHLSLKVLLNWRLQNQQIIIWKHPCCWTAAVSVATLFFYTAAYFNQTKENVVYNSDVNCISNMVYFNWSRNIDILIISF